MGCQGHHRCRSLIYSLIIVAAAATFAVSASDVREPVRRFEAALIESMRQSATHDLIQRKQHLASMVDQSFDLGVISRAVIGSYWDDLSEHERHGLSARIRDYAITTLAVRFINYQGERFEAKGEPPVDGDHVQVRSQFVDARGHRTQLDYVVLSGDHGPRIINVFFDGVSGIDIQRGEFAVFLRDGGAARLMSKLDELIAAQSK